MCECARSLSPSLVGLFATPWTIACQTSLSLGFSRQEYWSGLQFPSPRDFPDPRIKPASSVSPALAGELFSTESPGKCFGSQCCLKLVTGTLTSFSTENFLL